MNGLDEIDPKSLMQAFTALQARVAALEQRPVEIGAVDELGTDDLGTMRSGRFIAGEGDPDGGDFTGSALQYPPLLVTIRGVEYGMTIYGMQNGVVQFGLSSVNGSAVFSEGSGTIGAGGITLDGLTYLLTHTATNLGETRRGRLKMYLPTGKTIPAWGLDYDALFTSAEKLANPSFSAGVANWTGLEAYASGQSGAAARIKRLSAMVGGAAPNGYVFAVAKHPITGDIYIGGDFTTIGGITATRIAKWDGSVWSALGAGCDAAVYALAFDASGILYAGGRFTSPGTRIAKWDGSAWSALGAGCNSYVYALAVNAAGVLYAGGNFASPGLSIAKWDGLIWSSLGAGCYGDVYTLAVDPSGNLYVGGRFTSPGGKIAKWDGVNWSALGAGVGGDINALALDASGNLYVGGSFTSPGRNIAKWDGLSWSALGTGCNSIVEALALDPTENLYMGGSFGIAFGVAVTGIARLDLRTSIDGTSDKCTLTNGFSEITLTGSLKASGTGNAIVKANFYDVADALLETRTLDTFQSGALADWTAFSYLIVDAPTTTAKISMTVTGEYTVTVDGEVYLDTFSVKDIVSVNEHLGFEPYLTIENTPLVMEQVATPTTPAAGYNMIYFKADGLAYTLNSAGIESEVGSVLNSICNGRLTLSSGEAVPTGDTSGGTLYFTPYLGNRAALFVPGLGWRNYTFNELSISLAGKSTGKMLDVFLFDNGGTLALELVEWSNDSTRATQLALQDGVWVESGAAARRYLGTVRIASNGMGESSLLRRYVWNLNHPQPLPLLVSDTGAHTYTTTAWRSWNNNIGLRAQFILGQPGTIQAGVFARFGSSTGGQLSLGLDSTVAVVGPNLANLNASLISLGMSGNQLVGEGYHYVQVLEFGSPAYNSNEARVTALLWA